MKALICQAEWGAEDPGVRGAAGGLRQVWQRGWHERDHGAGEACAGGSTLEGK